MLNKNIARLRKSRGLTQVDFAKQLHVTQSAVSHWESGRSIPDTVQLFRIAEFFGVSVEELSLEVADIKQDEVATHITTPTQEKAPSTIDEQIMRELEGADVELVREVLNFIRFRKQGAEK